MRVPLGWLKDYVEIRETPQEIADRLTFSGIEVEAITTFGADIAGIVVGEVRDVRPHPNADRLRVCRVFDGERELQVVCGAPNVAVGGKYPLARVGARIAGGRTLERMTLRGVPSEGMLCAEDELGLSEDHSGLMVLPPEARPGTPVAELLGLPETVFDLEITPNRPDCLSILGVARELSVLLDRPLRHPPCDFEDATDAPPPPVEVVEPDLCLRYAGRVLTGVKIGPSPVWMQWRLRWGGVRPICNVVDITNYVMLELGHPLHAFDLARLNGGRIVVRRARPGECIRTLDGVERALEDSMLVIADAERPVAVAGVMGGEGSEITNDTREVLLESAAFQRASIRWTARALGLKTESSHRFARGVDPEGVDRASRRAAALIRELAGGQSAGVIDIYRRPHRPVRLVCRVARIAAITGAPATIERAERIFRALEMHVERRDQDVLEVVPPSFRPDLREEVDLVEEYARIEGLDRIPAPPPQVRVVPGADDEPLRALATARRQWIALGLTEVMNYSLCGPALLRRFGMEDERLVRLPNALSEEYSVLRPSLLPHVVETLGRNRARQIEHAAIFEIGRVFQRGDGEDGYREETRAAIALMGAPGRPLLDRRRPVTTEEAWRWLRGIVEHWLKAVSVSGWWWEEHSHPAFADGRSFVLHYRETPVGWAGIVRPSIAAEWRIHEPLAAGEIRLEPLVRNVFRLPTPAASSVYPASKRDLAFVVDQSLRHEDIVRLLREAGPTELESVEIFDIYRGPGIPTGKKSVAYSLTYRAADRTLTDEEIERFQARIIEVLRKTVQAEIRSGPGG